MTDEQPSDRGAVADFFAEQVRSDKYRSLKAQTEAFDRAAAAVLNERMRGRVLAIGGLWDYFERTPAVTELTVLDLSIEMLATYGRDDATVISGDFFEMELEAGSYDTVVFPLMLHHVAQGSWAECEARVRTALARATSLLAPGGDLMIYEYCPSPMLRFAQRLALPLTRKLLARNGQPLVVMHSLAFYREALEAAGGSSAVVPIPVRPPNPWAWYPIFMSSRWLRIPIGLYPKPYVLSN